LRKALCNVVSTVPTKASFGSDVDILADIENVNSISSFARNLLNQQAFILRVGRIQPIFPERPQTYSCTARLSPMPGRNRHHQTTRRHLRDGISRADVKLPSFSVGKPHCLREPTSRARSRRSRLRLQRVLKWSYSTDGSNKN
jgi:hypothetical protein